MTISFPSTSVNNDVSFFLGFEGMLPRDQSAAYRPDLLVFRDKTDNTDVSIADTGGGNLQILNTDQLYTGTGGYLSTTYNSALSLGTGAYTIEFIFLIPAVRAAITESILSVGAVAASNNWEIGIDNLGRPIFIHGTTTETATSATITDDILQHIAIVRTGTGANETKMYLNGIAVRTFTDATDYNYTDGLFIGSDRAGSGGTQVYFKNVRISTVARHTEDFTAPSSLPYVAIGDTYSYLDKVYKWSGVKWFDRSKYNASIPGEFRNYAAVDGSANTTTLDLRSANFFELDLVAGVDTEVVFENEALAQSFVMRVDQDELIFGFDITSVSYDNKNYLADDGNSKDGGLKFKPDGRKFYVSEIAYRSIHQYSLSTAWDLSSTVTYGGSEYLGGAGVQSFDISPDGVYVIYSGGDSSVVSYAVLPIPWNITSITSYSALIPTYLPSLCFGKNGNTIIAASGTSPTTITSYDLATPYNPTTLISTTASKTYSFNTLSFASRYNIRFNSDYSTLFIRPYDLANSSYNTRLYSYNLTTPGDIETIDEGTVQQADGLFGAQYEGGFDFKYPNGEKLYTVYDISTGNIRQWSSGGELAAPVITWPLNITWSTGTPPSITGTTLIEFYKYNGTWHGNVITENL